jgi:O-antigen/teichoic acid export membrane protein
VLFRNTLAQSAGLLASYLFSFLLAPLMLSRLGLDQFGVWAVTGALATYAGLLDLGVGRSLIRFVAIYDADGRVRNIRECLGLGLTAVVTVSAIGIGAAALVAGFLSDKLGVLGTADMRVVLISSVAIFGFNGLSGVLISVGLGKRLMIPPNIAMATGSAINFAFSVAALLASTDLVVYALANAAAAMIAIVPAYVAMRSVWKGGPHFALPSRQLVREVLGYGIKDQVGWMAELVNLQTDKIVIALAVDIRAAAVYEIASRVVMAMRGAAIMSVSAMVPTAAAQIVSEGREVVARLYRRFTQRSCAVSFPLYVLGAVTAPFLLIAWLDRAPGDSELLVPFLALAFLFNVSTGGGSTIALGAGNPGLVSVNAVIVAVLNVALTLSLAPFFGIWGVVGGTFLAMIVGSFRFTSRFLRHLDLPWNDFLESVLPTAGLAFGLAIPSALLAILVGTPPDRLTAVLLLAVSVPLYVFPYWLLATRFDLLPEKLRFPRMRMRGPRGPDGADRSPA